MWNERYSQPGFAYGTEPNDFLLEQVEGIAPGRVLCLAEGEGRNAVFLARQGHEVTAVDASAVGVEKTQKLAKQHGVSVETVVSDLADYQIEVEAFDVIVSIWCHVPPALRTALHRNVVLGLRGQGRFILEAYRPSQISRGTGGPKSGVLMMTIEGLREELRGLNIEIGREIERDVQEGNYHNGLSDVVQVMASKS